MTTSTDYFDSAPQRHWQNHPLLDLGQPRDQNCWACKATCPGYNSEITKYYLLTGQQLLFFLCSTHSKRGRSFGTYTGKKSSTVNRHEAIFNNLDTKHHMKSTQRKKVIRHSRSSDTSFPVVVNIKRNLTSSPKYIWDRVPLQSHKPSLRRARHFKTESRAKLSSITPSESFLKTIIFQ